MWRVILFWLIILGVIIFCAWQVCFADVFVIYRNDTKEIITMSEKDDTVLPAKCTQIKLNGTIQELGLDLHPVYYRYDKNKFIRNQAKIDAEEQEKTKQEEINKEVELVKGKMADENIAKLESEGVIFKHKAEVKEKLKKSRVDVAVQ